jgi:hypothetical protein
VGLKLLESDRKQLMLQQEILLLSCDLKPDQRSLSRLLSEKLALERKVSTLAVKFDATTQDLQRLSVEVDKLRRLNGVTPTATAPPAS